MSSNDEKYAHGENIPKFNEPAKIPPEQRHKHLQERLQQTDAGKRHAARIDRAGQRYEDRRVRREVTETRNQRTEQAERVAIDNKRSPQPVHIPAYIKGATGRSVRLTPKDLEKLKEGIGAVIQSNDATLVQNIRNDRLKLECAHLERAIDREECEAKAIREKAAQEGRRAFSERAQDRPRERFRDAVRGRATHVRDHGHGD